METILSRADLPGKHMKDLAHFSFPVLSMQIQKRMKNKTEPTQLINFL